MGDYNKKSLLFFIALLFWYSLIIIIDSNAWMFKDSSLYTLLSVILFYIWLFFIITYFVILFDIRKAFFKVRLFLIISTAFVIFASQYIWIYFLLLTLLLSIFKREVFKNIFTILSIIFILSASFYYTMLYAGLASDEEMIEHFKEHKAEFEEIVKRYRENNQTEWDNNSITKELLKNLGIYQINPICDTDYYKCIWLQNPYLIETAKKIESFTEYEKIHLLTKYGMIRVELMPRHKYWNSNLYYRAIRKDLYHIPEIPRLKNGKLLYPFNAIGQYSFNITILTSLNYISPKWQDKCVLKQIDSQWFLRACTAKRGNSGFITLWL